LREGDSGHEKIALESELTSGVPVTIDSNGERKHAYGDAEHQ